MARSPAFLYAARREETRSLTLSNGDTNRSPNAGKRYRGITWSKIVELAQNPPRRPKSKAPFVIPSTYREHDGRKHAVQREKGSFGLLALDFDSHTPLEHLATALAKVLGDVEWLAYSTSSATPEMQKLRGLIPLAAPMPGADFTATQKALFELLEAQGLEPDHAQSRTGQPVILPNRGEWYQHRHNKAPRLELHPEHPIIQRRLERAAEAAAEAQSKQEAQEARKKRRAAQRDSKGAVIYADDFESVVESFNAEHDLAGEFLRYGWVQHPGSPDDFHWPEQTTPASATLPDWLTAYGVAPSWKIRVA